MRSAARCVGASERSAPACRHPAQRSSGHAQPSSPHLTLHAGDAHAQHTRPGQRAQSGRRWAHPGAGGGGGAAPLTPAPTQPPAARAPAGRAGSPATDRPPCAPSRLQLQRAMRRTWAPWGPPSAPWMRAWRRPWPGVRARPAAAPACKCRAADVAAGQPALLRCMHAPARRACIAARRRGCSQGTPPPHCHATRNAPPAAAQGLTQGRACRQRQAARQLPGSCRWAA